MDIINDHSITTIKATSPPAPPPPPPAQFANHHHINGVGGVSTVSMTTAATTMSKSHSIMTLNQHEDDSGIEQDNTMLIRVCINDQNLQKVFKFNLDETVWLAKHKVLTNLARELRDGINYGFYLPSYQGRAGKFLDDCRLLREYPLNNGPQVTTLEANLKRFIDYVRTNQTHRVAKYLEKGLDPNFHSDVGETPLTIAVALVEPRDMIMNLYNGGSHLDFRSRDSLTPMHKAAQLGNDKSLNILLELGGFADVKDTKNLTPLFYAMINASSIKCVELLLYNGSVIGCKDDNNWQEVHYACKLGLSQHLDHLIYYGADLNARNNSGNTPLHICAIHKQESCARILLFRGADKAIRNLSNQTAYESAMISGNQAIADLIDKHRANEIVPIKDKPQFNLKRRSVYFESGSNYGTIYSNSTGITGISGNNSLTKSSVSTLNNPWNNSSNNLYGVNNNSIALRSRSMPKLENSSHSAHTSHSNSTVTSASVNVHNQHHHQQHQVVVTTTTAVGNSGSSSPTSRSHSISSDDHGIGSASLSQLSGSPNIEYAYPRKRLYASIPDRKFICIKSYKPAQAGELELRKGDIVEILSVGEQGYWEGRSHSNEGWFPSDCVEEIQLPKDGYNDSLVVKRKTLVDLIATSENNIPRTIVLQRGKKGYGFVLRGAKVTDKKFEPTAEIPALQFLENVDKGSNADKAGLKPLDFVLEINGIDVTCRTHDECVKLIKKSGDTLALKVLTVCYTSKNGGSSNGEHSNHYASTTVSQPPPSQVVTNGVANKSVPQPPPPPPPPAPYLSIPQDYTDGTKSLPHKNKPIPPKRHPNTSLTSIDSSTCMTSFIYTNNSISKSSTNLYSPSLASINNNNNQQQHDNNSSSATVAPLTSTTLTSNSSSTSSSLSTNEMLLNDNDLVNTTTTTTTNDAEQQRVITTNNTKILKKSLSVNSDNTSYMNFVLAQIDELDKTLAEYDSLNGATSGNAYNDSVSSRSKNMANDANAASIRTRVPVRKPGIDVNDNFTQMIANGSAKLQQKSYSVTNLSDNTAKITVDRQSAAAVADTISIASSNGSSKHQQMRTPTYNNNNKGVNLVKQNSASNDTLVQKYIEPEIDYSDDDNDDDDENDNVNNQTVIHAPVAAAPPPPPPPIPNSMMSTFNNSPNNKSSPLTPRQLKQRNSAKRSISRSSSTTNVNDVVSTGGGSAAPPPPPPPPLTLSIGKAPSTPTNRSSSQQPPQTPTRTSSTLVYPAANNNNNAKSEDLNEQIRRAAAERVLKAAQQPPQHDATTTPIIKSQTYTNGFQGTTDAQRKQQPPLQFAVRSELERAIENRIKRANNFNLVEQTVIETTTTKTTAVPIVQNGGSPSAFVKQHPPIYENQVSYDANKRNLPREPPPPLPPTSAPPALNRNNQTRGTVEIPPPPPPPLPPPTTLNVVDSNLPPPPSPTQLNRLNKIVHVNVATTTPVQKAANSPNKNLPSPSGSGGGPVVDPRTSSDFGALIAKKAAEKRAKFHEAKPSVNAVTFQADGSKVVTYAATTNGGNGDENHTNSSSNSLLTISVQPTTNGHTEPPKPSNYAKQNGINGTNNNIINKKPVVNGNNNIMNNNTKPLPPASQLVTKQQQQNINTTTTIDANLIYVNRNESFINTASKLLEKVKHQHQVTLAPISAAAAAAAPTTTNNNNIQVLPSTKNNNKKKTIE